MKISQAVLVAGIAAVIAVAGCDKKEETPSGGAAGAATTTTTPTPTTVATPKTTTTATTTATAVKIGAAGAGGAAAGGAGGAAAAGAGGAAAGGAAAGGAGGAAAAAAGAAGAPAAAGGAAGAPPGGRPPGVLRLPGKKLSSVTARIDHPASFLLCRVFRFRGRARAMIPRYSPREFAEIWSTEARYNAWLEVELCACEAMEAEGLVPSGTAASIREMNLGPRLDVARIEEIERTVKHDVIAFLTHVEELAGAPARWLHRGMTSSDVLDTSLALLLVRATDRLIEKQQAYVAALAARAREHATTPMIGRSHGIHAEPVTFGLALAGHAAEARRGLVRLQQARAEIAVGKIAGAVGTYAHLSPSIEAAALSRLGLSPETVSTQVVARDRHASFFAVLAVVGAGIERLATNVRHWQRTEVGEAEEPFTAGQKGSSAMPHKRNPILSENLTGLARMLRGYAIPALEDVALWHERDISHSSVERFIAPDATTTLAFMQERARTMIDGMVVYPARLQANLERTGGLFFSEALLLALVEKGIARQQGYVLVQRNAMKAIQGEGTFRENLLADDEVRGLLGAEGIERAFDQEHALRYARALVDRALT